MIPRVFAILACLFLCSGAFSASATVELQVASGELIGARNVQVGSDLYDVVFVEGTCAGVFASCATMSTDSFLFTTATEAEAAAQALLEDVLTDGPAGLFDSDPTKTFGCEYPDGCTLLTPFDYYSSSATDHYVQTGAAYNYPPSTGDLAMHAIHFLSSNTLDEPSNVWAVWSPHVAPVPEPSTLLISASGFLTWGAMAWRRRKH